MKNTIAILMAAGKGERMRPLTENTPKPLIKVFGKSMIETIIEGLCEGGVEHIYVVVGYKKEKLYFLKDKYPNLTIVDNPDFMTVNNISSIKAVADIMGKNDCFICEADLYVSDLSIFKAELNKSCYFGKMVKGYSDDWVFDQDKNGRITRVGKYGTDCYNMCGVSWFKKDDAKIIADAVKETYTHKGEFENLFWDEVVDRNLDKVDMTVHEVFPNQIKELDSEKELKEFDPDYKKYN